MGYAGGTHEVAVVDVDPRVHVARARVAERGERRSERRQVELPGRARVLVEPVAPAQALGELLERVAAGEKVAARGEVVVCADVAQNLGDRLLSSEQRTADSDLAFSLVSGLVAPVEGRPWLNLPANGLVQYSLRPWLLPPVYNRLTTGHGQFLAELRNSVALFLNFAGLDYDGDPEVGEKLDRFIRRRFHNFHQIGTLATLITGNQRALRSIGQ